jgi:hypothetical protein
VKTFLYDFVSRQMLHPSRMLSRLRQARIRQKLEKWKSIFLDNAQQTVVEASIAARGSLNVFATSSQMCQAALQGSDHSLSSVIHIQPLQYRAHMTLHRSLGNAKHTGDLLVAVPADHQLQHFTFAGTQV